MHTPHLAAIGAAESEDDHEQARAMLSKASPAMTGAVDFLLETYADEELPADLAAAVRSHLEKNNTMAKARKWMSHEGYGLVHHVARQHTISYGGSVKGFKKFLRGLGHVIEAPFKFGVKLLTSGARAASSVAEAAAPAIGVATDVASKVAPMIA